MSPKLKYKNLKHSSFTHGGMWTLKMSVSDYDPWVISVNNHMGREFWDFDPNLGSAEERSCVEKIREKFRNNRF